MTEKLETVWFTTKGQVVIPLRLRKQFDIEDGTKAVVQATPEGILLKPMTAALIKRGRGILRRAPGGKPLTRLGRAQEARTGARGAACRLRCSTASHSSPISATSRARRRWKTARLRRKEGQPAAHDRCELRRGEVLHCEERRRGGVGGTAKVLQGLPIDFHSTTRALADTAADFKARFKLSLADAFAAALAKERRTELVTGDLEFKPLEREIKVHRLK